MKLITEPTAQGGLKGLIFIKHLEQSLAHSKYCLSVRCHSYPEMELPDAVGIFLPNEGVHQLPEAETVSFHVASTIPGQKLGVC